MQSSEMLRRVTLIRSDVSEERIAFMFRMERIRELGTKCDYFRPDDGGYTFLQDVGSYKSQRRLIPEDGILNTIPCWEDCFLFV
jgi:hypothetical protein